MPSVQILLVKVDLTPLHRLRMNAVEMPHQCLNGGHAPLLVFAFDFNDVFDEVLDFLYEINVETILEFYYFCILDIIQLLLSQFWDYVSNHFANLIKEGKHIVYLDETTFKAWST